MSVRAKAKYEITAVDKTAKAFKSVKSNIGAAGKALGGFRTAIGGAIGAGGLALMVKRAVDAGDKIAKLSTRLGITTEALSRLQYAAKSSGVSTETLNMALQRMVRRVAEAGVGTGEAVDALAELGLNAELLSQQAPEKQMEAIADALQNVENHSDKVRLAMKLFDSEGVALLQMLEGGADAMRKFGKESDELGNTLDANTAKQMEKAAQALDRIDAAMTGVTRVIAVEFLPAIEQVSEWLIEGVKWARDFGRSVGYMAFRIEQALRPVMDFIERAMAQLAALKAQVLDTMSVLSMQGAADWVDNVAGSRATGGMVAAGGLYRLEPGERVVSNTNHFGGINITMNGADMDANKTRRWVRSVLIPEIQAAHR